MRHSIASGKCASRIAARGVAALLLALGPTAICLAQTPTSETAATVSLFGGNITMGSGASLRLKDALEGSSGVSGVFRPRFNIGLRIEGHRRWFGLALETSSTLVESPVTMTRWGLPQSRRTIRYMETGGSVLAMVRAPLPVLQPYAGFGPTVLVNHADSEGSVGLTAGLLFVAGTQVWFGRRVFGFAEARYNLLPDRHYTFDVRGMQDPVYPTMAATVSGSHSSIVFGIGLRLKIG